MSRILTACSSKRIGAPVRPSWISDLLIRGVQKVYDSWPWSGAIPFWEDFAQDRTQWANYAHWWLKRWLAQGAVVSFEQLMDI